ISKASISPLYTRSYKGRYSKIRSLNPIVVKSQSNVVLFETTKRRSANYHPSIWNPKLIESLTTPYTYDSHGTRLEELKQEVIRSLASSKDTPCVQLKLIDSMQRLGIAYHFEEEMKEILTVVKIDTNSDLYTTALHLRLLRQHAFPVSSGVLDKFRDKNGKFLDSLARDVEGLLSLYDASHLGMHGEDVLEEAKNFTSHHLKSLLGKLESNNILRQQVEQALDVPLHWRMRRIENRNFINIYQRDDSHNKALLELAILDYNLVQTTWYNQSIKRRAKGAKQWARLCSSYLLEARWFSNGYTPTLNEYIRNAWISIGGHEAIMHAAMFLGHYLSKDSLHSLKNGYEQITYWSSLITRLNDDLGTSSDALWVRVFCSKYKLDNSLDSAAFDRPSSSFICKGIGRETINKYVGFDGNWNWTILCSLLPPDILARIAAVLPPSSEMGPDEPVRVFLWILSDDRLLTNLERRRRHLSTSSLCALCSITEESSLHAVRDCLHAAGIWHCVIPRHITGWLIWKNRNAIIFSSAGRDVFAILLSAKSLASSCVTLDTRLSLDQPSLARCDWGSAYGGGLIRDCLGHWKTGFAFHIRVTFGLGAELWAIPAGIRLAISYGFSHILIESDNLLAVSMVLVSVAGVGSGRALVRNISLLLHNHPYFSISHVVREANYCADWLASYASSLSLGFQVPDDPPPGLGDWLAYDCRGLASIRRCPC
ncbi:uncharacterized protein LOC105631124, partial [Jatropha curcas]|uniref:uncharacterized protein LOC105631124 n=1 Tax=Jatropha curcas TaxID=180498 RepID=UPI0018939E7E